MENLLLASAVKKHGTDQWSLVSSELRALSHNPPPAYFAPEACRFEFYAIKDRYSNTREEREGDLGNDMPWFEELRKLRVDQLRKELQRHDTSIGLLQTKLQRLRSESEKSLRIASAQKDQTEPICQNGPHGRESEARGNGSLVLEGRATIEASDSSKDAVTHGNEEERHDLKLEGGSVAAGNSPKQATVQILDQDRYVQGDDREMVAFLQANSNPKDVGGDHNGNLVEMHRDTSTDGTRNHVQKHSDAARQESLRKDDEVGLRMGAAGGVSSNDVAKNMKMRAGERKELVNNDENATSKEQSLHKTTLIPRNPFSSLLDHRESPDNVSSTRHEHNSLPLKHRRGAEGHISGKENCLLGGEFESIIMPVESADSTAIKLQKNVPSVSESKKSCQPPLKTELHISEATSKAATAEIIIREGNESVTSGEVVTKLEVRNSRTSSAENWGESAEVLDNNNITERITSRGRKGKLNKSINMALKEEQLENRVQVESEEGCDSIMHNQCGDACDTKAWNQIERLSGDSRVERSEVGSFVDTQEDISSTRRKNRREAKVSGKLLPLLESLRTICAHKIAPLFKHTHETNPRYDRLIRTKVDLSSIRRRLEEGQYSGSLPFFRDLQLMVNNALVYYPKDAQEFGAATGLRECIKKEMANVFETEALLKQDGPSIRKRKWLPRSAASDKVCTDTGIELGCDVRTNVGNHDKSSNQIQMGTKNEHKGTKSKRPNGSLEGQQLSKFASKEDKETRALPTHKATEDEGGKVDNSKTSKEIGHGKAKRSVYGGQNKAERGVLKNHGVVEDLDSGQCGVKRRVGRPPTHSNKQQVGEVATNNTRAPNPIAKRVRR